MAFAFGQKSLSRLVGVHPDLVAVVKLAITVSKVDFSIVQGLRTKEQEAEMVAKGASTTMHSRHLPNKQGLGCAIDFAAYVNGGIVWNPVSLYNEIFGAFLAAGDSLKIPVEWGGNWLTFKDYGHVQLPWAKYP